MTVPARAPRTVGWVPFALIALVVIPSVAGTLRLVDLAGGPHLLPADPRLSASPVPVIVHIVGAVGYAVLGAFQFSTALRRRRPAWHRVAGRVLVILGLAVAFSALWMVQFYPPKPGTGALTAGLRIAFGTGMATGLVLGVVAVRRGDVTAHRAWMTRAYALALGAGTQVFTLGLGTPVLGTGESANGVLMGAAWLINLTVAEYVIRRPARVSRTSRRGGRARPRPSLRPDH